MEIQGGNRVLAAHAMALSVSLMRRDGATAAEIIELLYGQLAESIWVTPADRDRLHQRMEQPAMQQTADS